MRSGIHCGLWALTFLWLLILPAAAAPITDDGAQRLKTLFETQIEKQRQLSAIDNAAQITYDGVVSVEKADGYYAVTLPYLRQVYQDGRKLNIGIIAINASEHSVPGQWKMTVALPTPITLVDEKNMPAGKISIGTQRALGIWDEAAGNFIKLDAGYENLKMASETEGFELLLGGAQMRYDLNKDEQNLWSGVGFMALKNFDLGFINDPTKTNIEELRLDFSLAKYNPEAAKSYQDRLIAILNPAQKTPDKDAAALTQEQGAAIYDILSEFLQTGLDGFKGEYSLTGLTVSTLIDNTTKNISLAKGRLGFDMSGFNAGLVTFGWQLGYSDLAYTPMPKGHDVFLPADAAIAMTVARIPLKDIAALGKNALQASAQNPQMQQLMGLSLMMQLPALLSQAQTAVTAERSFAENDTYRVDFDGRAQADPTAVSGFTAQGKLVFRGLEDLLAQAKTLAADPEPSVAQDYRDIALSLEKLKGYARIDSGGNNGPLHIFEIIFNAQGEALLNGENINDLFMPAPAAPAPAEDTAPAR